MTNPQDQFLDLYRAGLNATAEVTKAMLEGAERLRTLQLAAIQEALAAHTSAAAGISAARGMDDLLEAQTNLAGTPYQAALGYWSGLYQAAGETQLEINRSCQSQLAQMRDTFQQALSTAPVGSNPVMQAFQALMDATSSAFALTARATEEAAKLAAAQATTATAGIRQQGEPSKRKSA